MKKDHCTAFPETWVGVDIHLCCKLHDRTCSTVKFYLSLKRRFDKAGKKGWIHASYITFGGTVGCLFKYPSKLVKVTEKDLT